MWTKVCRRCKREKTILNFKQYWYSYKQEYRIQHICYDCQNIKMRKRRKIVWVQRRNNERKYLETHPWAKKLKTINSRCCSKNHHYYGRVKNYLTMKSIKYLWFRDNADKMSQPSIHRLNNKKHYTINNCVFIEFEEHKTKRWGKREKEVNGGNPVLNDTGSSNNNTS